MPTASYKCPNCGGGLRFAPDLQKNKCEFCLSVFSDEELARINAAMEASGDSAAARDTVPGEDVASTAASEAAAPAAKGYVCNNCGAEVVTEATTSATYCYYCHNPVLLTDRLSGDYRPTRIIPFAYDREKAISKLLNWAKKKPFVPNSFYSASQLEKVTGLYIPYWMADTQAQIDLSGKGINRRTWVTGNTEYTETKEFQIERHGTIEVDHLHEIANRKIDQKLLDAITPYDENQAIEFSMSYLNGFLAEKYDIAREEVHPRILDRAKGYVSSMVQETLASYQQVQMQRSDIEVAVKGWDYALFPAWILTYLYRGKTYIYAVNGQNGKSFGELPVDNKKLGLVSGLIAAGILILAIIGGILLW